MSQIITEVYDALRAAKVDDDLARAAAGAVGNREDLVTKLDLERTVGQVKADLTAEIADVKADLKLVKFAYGPVILGLLIKLVFFP